MLSRSKDCLFSLLFKLAVFRRYTTKSRKVVVKFNKGPTGSTRSVTKSLTCLSLSLQILGTGLKKDHPSPSSYQSFLKKLLYRKLDSFFNRNLLITFFDRYVSRLSNPKHVSFISIL